jgi:hypothetical protein
MSFLYFDRSFSLQALAFRGEEVEPPRRICLRGLDFSSIYRRTQVPSATIHSVLLNSGYRGNY